MHSSPDRVVRVQAWPQTLYCDLGGILYSNIVSLSTQVYKLYKQVPVNLMLGVTLQWTSIPFRGRVGVEMLLVTPYYRNRYDRCSLSSNTGLIFYHYLPLQRFPVTCAPQRFFPISKTKFWWTSIKCFHDNIVVFISCQFLGHVRTSLNQV